MEERRKRYKKILKGRENMMGSNNDDIHLPINFLFYYRIFSGSMDNQHYTWMRMSVCAHEQVLVSSNGLASVNLHYVAYFINRLHSIWIENETWESKSKSKRERDRHKIDWPMMLGILTCKFNYYNNGKNFIFRSLRVMDAYRLLACLIFSRPWTSTRHQRFSRLLLFFSNFQSP